MLSAECRVPRRLTSALGTRHYETRRPLSYVTFFPAERVRLALNIPPCRCLNCPGAASLSSSGNSAPSFSFLAESVRPLRFFSLPDFMWSFSSSAVPGAASIGLGCLLLVGYGIAANRQPVAVAAIAVSGLVYEFLIVPYFILMASGQRLTTDETEATIHGLWASFQAILPVFFLANPIAPLIILGLLAAALAIFAITTRWRAPVTRTERIVIAGACVLVVLSFVELATLVQTVLAHAGPAR